MYSSNADYESTHPLIRYLNQIIGVGKLDQADQ